MNHLIDFGVCALVGCTNYIILHNYFLDILKLQYESRLNILKSYSKVRYLVECLGYIAFILEFISLLILS